MPASKGAAWLMVNVTVLAVPPGVVTVIFCGPTGAVAAMLKVAVIWVAVMTTPVAVMPAPRFRVALVKSVPVRVTGTVVPVTASAGAMVASVGVGGLIVNVTVPL